MGDPPLGGLEGPKIGAIWSASGFGHSGHFGGFWPKWFKIGFASGPRDGIGQDLAKNGQIGHFLDLGKMGHFDSFWSGLGKMVKNWLCFRA